MENSRTIEILRLMQNELGFSKDFKFVGICDTIFALKTQKKVTTEEVSFILDLLRDNKPNGNNKYSKYTKGYFWIDRLFWWDTIDEEPKTKQVRTDFINDLISNIK